MCPSLYTLSGSSNYNIFSIDHIFIYTVLQPIFLISSLLDFIIHFSNLITFNTFQIVFKRPSLETHCNWGEHMKVPLSCTAELGTYLASHTLFNWFRRKFVCVCPPLSQFFRPCTPHWNFLLIFNIFSRYCIVNSNSICHFHVRWKMVYYFHIPAKNFYLFSQPQYLKLRVRLKANIYFSKKYFPHSLHFFDSRLSFFAELWLYMWCVFVMAVHSATVLNLLLLLA